MIPLPVSLLQIQQGPVSCWDDLFQNTRDPSNPKRYLGSTLVL